MSQRGPSRRDSPAGSSSRARCAAAIDLSPETQPGARAPGSLRLLLIGNYERDRQESMQRYARMLLEGLRERGHQVQLIQPALILGKSTNVVIAKWLGYIDKFVLFRRSLQRAAAEADLVHICDHSNAMYLSLVAGMPHVITCHDLLAIRSARGHFPQNPVGASGRVFQSLIARGLRRAGAIACVSEKTRDDLEQHLHVPAEQLHVVPNALHWPYRPLVAAEREPLLCAMGIDPERRYVLHVGAGHWYKNRAAVLAIAHALRRRSEYQDLHVIFAGGDGSEFGKTVSAQELGAALHQIARPSNEQLQALYSGALALVFPSLEEGFGWPVLEAQACGCPVVIADRRPMRDIAGDAAVLIDPTDPDAAAERIATALVARDALVARGIANAGKYSRERMLLAYERLYQQVLQDPRA